MRSNELNFYFIYISGAKNKNNLFEVLIHFQINFEAK